MDLIEPGFNSPESLLDARDKNLEAILVRRGAVYAVLAWQAESKPKQKVHVLDPTLGPQMINNHIQNADGSPIRFAELDGTLLQFATAAHPAKQPFAFLRSVNPIQRSPGTLNRVNAMQQKVGWAAAAHLTMVSIAWGSET